MLSVEDICAAILLLLILLGVRRAKNADTRKSSDLQDEEGPWL
jgi:hypothetical protein